jgi:hypothetical protein
MQASVARQASSSGPATGVGAFQSAMTASPMYLSIVPFVDSIAVVIASR